MEASGRAFRPVHALRRRRFGLGLRETDPPGPLRRPRSPRTRDRQGLPHRSGRAAGDLPHPVVPDLGARAARRVVRVPAPSTGRREPVRVTFKSTRIILIAAALLSVWGVWTYDLWAPDEPYFGEGAREMIADGHWAVPHVNGEVTTDKPPLLFWLIALVSLPLGKVVSLTARVPSLLASLGTVWLTIRMGRRQGGDAVGALAGIVLMTTYLFWDKARTAQIDAVLCFLILVALSAF